MKQPPLILSQQVYDTLSQLIDSLPEDTITEQLINELERADIVEPDKLPCDVVTMHSQVTFTVQSTGKTFSYRLVYPTEVDDTENHLSILTPVGSALIGLQQGQAINWHIGPNKTTTISVDKVMAAGRE